MKTLFSLTLGLTLAMGVKAQQVNVIPQPAEVVIGKGTVDADKTICSYQTTATPVKEGAYTLTISKNSITIETGDDAGVQYAEETLKQLKAQYGHAIPAMTIKDAPQYEWRGLMLDCSRHFYTLEYLKQTVDRLAHFKMNRLHLHLTDDQGWRIEIKRYPQLTQQGAWREFNQQDSICIKDYADRPEFQLDPRFIIKNGDKTLYGGFYTQEELRELVRYATERHVEIIPEIDMPGHTQAISSLYPQFTATGEAKWGTVFSYPLSPAKEEVYTFMQNILDEVLDIFPSQYIHIGADEVEKETWKKSDECKALMEREGYQTYEALQSYFVNRIHKYLRSKGREMICWDDAIEGGDYKASDNSGALESSANIMYWRYWVGGVPQHVVEQGHPIIFTPGDPMYIASLGGPLYNIYNYDGYDKIAPEYQHLVRGGQVCLWAEGISNYRRADYSIYPRLLALAERLWTPNESRNWLSFKKRLDVAKQWLSAQDIQYAKTDAVLSAIQTTDLQHQQMLLTFDSEFADPDIRYTLDGSTPTMNSSIYNNKALAITKPVDVVAAIMENGQPKEPMFRRHLEYHKAVGAKVEYTTRRWHESYKAAEMATFTDGKRGTDRGFGDGLWQGFTSSFEVVVDLGKEMPVESLSMRFLQDIGPGVFMPGSVEFSFSTDSTTYGSPLVANNTTPNDVKGVFVQDFAVQTNSSTRYIKVKANNTQGGFIFADEIVVK